MPEYGFVIDQRRCIGCHACTTACKSENEVPVGNFRTWVKYTEQGQFPAVKRHFSVLRCNHCDDAPCVQICPVNALHKRPDAIVDLDKDLCIGCSSCIQACPYDALYINQDTGTAEKCHYCAHRTEIGLEPACVVVCPEEAIISGDMSDPNSKIARLLDAEETSVRRPEKGTKPRTHYIDVLEESLQPGVAKEPDAWIWSERRIQPANVPGFDGEADLLTVLNVDHPPRWGWHIWTYLFTKNLAAGAMMLAPMLGLLGVTAGPFGAAPGGILPEAIALLMLGLTGWFLIDDLERPERFLKIIFSPNTNSWLVKGTWVLMAFGGLTTASLAAIIFGFDELVAPLRWLNLPVAAAASGYSAYLFAQCNGRDLWLEKGMLRNLIARATMLGAGLAALLPQTAISLGTGMTGSGALATFGTLVLMNAIFLRIELNQEGVTAASRKAHKIMVAEAGGTVLPLFWIGAAVALAGSVLLPTGIAAQLLGAAVLVATGASLFRVERAWIRAAQRIPNS